MAGVWLVPGALRSALELEGSSLVSNSECPDTAVWVTSSGKPTLRPFSWRGWKTRPWKQLLCGAAVSRTSTGFRGLERWISSLLGSPASPFPKRADGGACPTPAGSFPTSSESFAMRECGSSSSRTCGASPGAVQTTFSGPWPISGLMRSGTCSARPTWARPTAGSGGSASPSEGTAWATPTAHTQRTRHKQGGLPWAELWTTPGANDWKGSSRPGQRRGQLDEQVVHRFPLAPTISMRGADSSTTSPTSLRLNPRFVDWLMGWLPGWTACAPLETGSCRWWRRLQSECLGRALAC